MGIIQENKVSPEWVDNLYQIEMTDPVTGGADGVANKQAVQLGARTQWLRKENEKRELQIKNVLGKKSTLTDFGLVKLSSVLAEDDESTAATPKGVLDAINDASVSVVSIAALRKYTGQNSFVSVNGYYDNTPGVGGGLFVADASDTTTADNGGTVIVSVDGTRWYRQSETVWVADFGVLGNGSDETKKIQNALNVCAAERKQLNFVAGKTYWITKITLPRFSIIGSAGAGFRKISASSEPVVTIDGDVSVDVLAVTSPGSATDNAVRLVGNNIRIGEISVKSESRGSKYGIHVESSIGIPLKNIKIERSEITNYDGAMLLFGVEDSAVNDTNIKCYRTGVYLRDVASTNFIGARMSEKSPNATGQPGHNGLLVESAKGDYSTNNLNFSDWVVADAAEHGYRFGGQFGIKDVTMSMCMSKKSGNHGGTSSGGCGFKILGPTSVADKRHKNFKLFGCHVEDVNLSGGGIGNFSGYQFSVVDGVVMNGCTIEKVENQEYACWDAIYLESATNVVLSGNLINDFARQGIRVSSEVNPTYPGWDGLLDGLYVDGGCYRSDGMSNAPVVFFDVNSTSPSVVPGTVKNVVFTGVSLRGGMAALRMHANIAYENISLDFDYDNGQTSGAAPVLPGKIQAYYNARMPWYGYSPSAKDGSIVSDKLTGTVRMRKGDGWVVL